MESGLVSPDEKDAPARVDGDEDVSKASKQTPVADAEATLAARRTAATAPINVRFTPESGH